MPEQGDEAIFFSRNALNEKDSHEPKEVWGWSFLKTVVIMSYGNYNL